MTPSLSCSMAQTVARLFDSANARPQGVVGAVTDFSEDASARGLAEEPFAGGNWLVTNGGARSRGQSSAAVIRNLWRRVIGRRSLERDHPEAHERSARTPLAAAVVVNLARQCLARQNRFDGLDSGVVFAVIRQAPTSWVLIRLIHALSVLW